MKAFANWVLIGLLLAPAAAWGATSVYTRISMLEGEVQLSGKDLEDWTDAELNMPLGESDRLWVHDDGHAEVHLNGGFYIRANGGTSLDVLSLDSGSIQFYLDRGHIYVNNLRGGIKVVQIDTPLASVRSYDNSIMMLDVAPDGRTEVSVLKGFVVAENRAGATRVTSGRTLTLGSEGTADLAPIGPTDDWERWNRDRDRQLPAFAEGSRYLPDELQEYSSDLDRGGQWVFVQEYGYVWTPVVTFVDWAPYSVGRWTWFRGNYVWVSAESWGWAPYHYGRWVFIAGRGWCWVPPAPREVFWGPGYVGWIVTGTTVGWVPLAPGEVFYGYGYFGPNTVNLSVVNINTVVVNPTYRNQTVENGIIITDRDRFTNRGWQRRVVDNRPDGSGKRQGRVDHIPPPVAPPRIQQHDRDHDRDQKRAGTNAPSGGQPGLDRTFGSDRGTGPDRKRQEDRGALEQKRREAPPSAPPMAQPRPAEHERRQPPEQVRQIRPDDIRTQRRLTREQGGSAFREQRPAELNVRQQNVPKVIERRPPPHPPKQTKEHKEQQQK